jgi:hypothetical protein
MVMGRLAKRMTIIWQVAENEIRKGLGTVRKRQINLFIDKDRFKIAVKALWHYPYPSQIKIFKK